MKIQNRIDYKKLNSRQQENYNFQKIAAALADYGFNTIRLSDDWQGADAIAINIDNKSQLKVQIKGCFTLDNKYIGKDIWIAFQDKQSKINYIFPHDELIYLKSDYLSKHKNFFTTHLSKSMADLLEQYKL